MIRGWRQASVAAAGGSRAHSRPEMRNWLRYNSGAAGKKRVLQVVHVRERIGYPRGIELLKQWQNEKIVALRPTGQKSESQQVPLDALLFLEHSPAYTLGRGADPSNVLFDPSSPNSPSVYRSERGGEVTYHGPGQIVGYPVLDLRRHQKDLHWYMRQVEQVIIQVLERFELKGSRKEKYTGVWVEDAKACAIGLNASKWVTSHGFALNVTTSLDAFDKIVPCGITEHGTSVTSIEKLLSGHKSMKEGKVDLSRLGVQRLIVQEFADVFGYDHIRVEEVSS